MKNRDIFKIVLLVLVMVSITSVGSSSPVAFYRLVNNVEHFYTINEDEADSAVKNYGYTIEGIAGYIYPNQVEYTVPFYRLVNNVEHFYTIDKNEADNAVKNYGYTIEGIAGYIYPNQVEHTVPFYRLVNNVEHFYTINEDEANRASGCTQSYCYTKEGIAGYIYPPKGISITSDPSGAEVIVDGASKGIAHPTLTVTNIDQGSHTVKCKLSGYHDFDTSTTSFNDRIVQITCTLTPVPVITTPLITTPAPVITTPAITTPAPDIIKPGPTTPTPGFNLLSGPQLKVSLTSEPASIGPGQTSTITIRVTGSNGEEISGADVMLSSTGGKFNPISGQTNSFGLFTSTFTTPGQGKVTLGARIRKEGFSDGSGEIKIDVSSSADQTATVNQATAISTSTAAVQTSPSPGTGTNLSIILVVLLILVISCAVIYFLWKKKKSPIEPKKATLKSEEPREKKKFCMFCHAPIALDSDYCNKCGKKQDETKRFCMSCGALMPSVPELCGKCSMMPPSGDDTKNCRNCGEVIPVVAKFCSACGAGQPE